MSRARRRPVKSIDEQRVPAAVERDRAGVGSDRSGDPPGRAERPARASQQQPKRLWTVGPDLLGDQERDVTSGAAPHHELVDVAGDELSRAERLTDAADGDAEIGAGRSLEAPGDRDQAALPVDHDLLVGARAGRERSSERTSGQIDGLGVGLRA